MNRTFHARIAPGQYLCLLLVAFVAIYGFWQRQPFIGIVPLLLLVLMVERLIHTTYTVTSQGTLQIYYGRFARMRTIHLEQVTSMRRVSVLRVGRFSLMHYVLLSYGAGQSVALMPVKEQEFMDFLARKQDFVDVE